jgi:hypothetical protein
MKHFFLLLFAIPFFSPTLFSQNTPLQGFIQKQKDKPGFTYAFLSKDLFEVATQSNIPEDDWNGLHQVIQNIGSLHILAADSLENGLPLYKEARELISDDAFDELLTVRDGNENVRIWAKSEENVITDLVLLVGSPDEFVLVCFTGNLELGNLNSLASMFESGKATQLAKTSALVAMDFSIYPNPSNGVINIQYQEESEASATLSVLDQNGRFVANILLTSVENQQIMLPDLNPGTYWVQLKTKSGKVGVKQMQIVR